MVDCKGRCASPTLPGRSYMLLAKRINDKTHCNAAGEEHREVLTFQGVFTRTLHVIGNVAQKESNEYPA